MREYIHFFENSDLRDAYENGSDYTEPYVSYTPVINGYEAQFNGRTIDNFAVTKQGNSYLISSNSNSIEIINEEEFEEPPTVNSNVFYISNVSVIDNGAHIYVFPEDLELTEESTEFTFNGVTYAIESNGTNTWSVVGRNPDEGLHFSNIAKFDIVSVPSSSNDFVHYNKIPPAKSIYAKIKVEYNESNDQPAVMRRKISSRNNIFEKIIVDGNEILFNNEEPIRGQDNSVYYTFSSEGTHKIEYVLKDEYAGIMPRGMIPSYSATFDEITLPKGIYKIESDAFNWTRHTGTYLKLNIPDTINEVENSAVVCIEISQEAANLLLSINPNAIYSNCK